MLRFVLLLLFCISPTTLGCGFVNRFMQAYPNIAFSSSRLSAVDSSCCSKFGTVPVCSVSGNFEFQKSKLCGSPWFLKVETIKQLNVTKELYNTYLLQEELAWVKCDVPFVSQPQIGSSNCTLTHSATGLEGKTIISLKTTCSSASYACSTGSVSKHGTFTDSSDISFLSNPILPIFCSVSYELGDEVFLVGSDQSDVCVYYGISSLHTFILCNYPLLKFVLIAFLIFLCIKLAKVLIRLTVKFIMWTYVIIQVIRGKRVWEYTSSRTTPSKDGSSTKTKVLSIFTILFMSVFSPASGSVLYRDVSVSSTIANSNVTICDAEFCSVSSVLAFSLLPSVGTCFVYNYVDARFQPVKTRICVEDFSYRYPVQEEYYTSQPTYYHFFDGYCIGSPKVSCPNPKSLGYVTNMYFNSDINQGCWIWGQTDLCTTTDVEFNSYPSYVYTIGSPIPDLRIVSTMIVDGVETETKVLGELEIQGQFYNGNPFELTNGRKIVRTPTGVDVAFAPSKYEVLPFRWGSYQMSDTAHFFPPNPIKYSNCKGPNGGFGCTMEIPDYSYSATLPKPLSEYTLGKSIAAFKGDTLFVKPLNPAPFLITIRTNYTVSLVNDKPCPQITEYSVLNSFYGLGESNPLRIRALSTCSPGFASITASGCTISATDKCYLTSSEADCDVSVIFPSTTGSCRVYLSGVNTASIDVEFSLKKAETLTNQTSTTVTASNAGSINNGVGFLESQFGFPNYVLYLIIPLVVIFVIVFFMTLYYTMKGNISAATKTKSVKQL